MMMDSNITDKPKHVMPWWVSAASSALIVSFVALAGVHQATSIQKNPDTVWGWWNKKEMIDQQHQLGKISFSRWSSEMKVLETKRVEHNKKEVAKTLMPFHSVLVETSSDIQPKSDISSAPSPTHR